MDWSSQIWADQRSNREAGWRIRPRLRLVLWFDPERHYEAVVRNLRAGQDHLLVFDGSFYKLRLEAEPFLRGLDPPKLLVYLPVRGDGTGTAG